MSYKIPKAVRLPSGNWNLKMMLGGKRISITKPTERECTKQASLLRAQNECGLFGGAVDSKLTVGDAIDMYIESRKEVLSPSTVAGYMDIRRTRFRDVIDRKVCTITNWQRVISNESNVCSPKTLYNAWGLLRPALEDIGIEVKNVRLPQRIQKDRPFLQPEQIPIMIEACSDSAVEIQVLLGLHGLRRSEIYAVNKEDISNGIIRVRGAKVRSNNGYVVKKTTKTDLSRRDVPVLIPRLAELVAERPKGLLCPNDPTTDYKRINNICKKNGLPLVGFHGLRHSFASLCYHLGLSELEAMRLGGWSDMNTMRRIYTHLAESDKMEATNKLKDFFALKG